MASTKKYAGLPDLDDAGTELYQTPGLTDDASTIQTNTLRTDSPTSSDDINENLDRTQFNREEARRRFEPAVVGTRDVNFSYAVGGNQRSYTSKHRRRRRVRRSDGVEEYGDISDEDVEVEESLPQKLARLKREAEEVRLEIEQREKEDDEFQDTYEHHEGEVDMEENDTELSRDMNDLTRLLGSLQTSVKPKHTTLEEELGKQLNTVSHKSKPHTQSNDSKTIEASSNTNISAIAAFSDRLSALESVLGFSSASPASNPTSILPTLDTLSSQLNRIQSVVSPKQTSASTSAQLTDINPQMPHLDILQARLHHLHQTANTLVDKRKTVQSALTELETLRLRGVRTADHLARFQTLANRRATQTRGSTIQPLVSDDTEDEEPRPTSPTKTPRITMIEDSRERVEIADEILTPLFLEDQVEKIKALYNVLPTIQDLQPLLPIVLERLRGLSIVHAGAANARADMDDLEGRLRDWEAELAKWKDAVVGVEDGIDEVKDVMKENLDVVGGMVRRVEERVAKLQEK